MQTTAKNGFHRTCVLPFQATPPGLGPLRKVVRSHLTAWGMPGCVEEAQLAVTELATNVIKHVGEGAVATLVLEPITDRRLRIELHDTSHALPLAPLAADDAERGRGLHLLAALSAEWGTTVTGAGKAVWCEILLAPDDTRHRVQRATAVLDTYWRHSRSSDTLLTSAFLAQEEAATGLIADLLHWLHIHGSDPDTILDRAQMHYEADLKEA